MNYYNEIDPYAAAWPRELIARKLIPAGEVDERSITDVSPTDLSGFIQCHFFAGIGGWSLALQLAGWPSDRPVWTGSCPCQPFSSAGKGLGRKDPRHLWPAFRRLINRCAPPVVIGEQVASADGRRWLAGVFSNLETMGYAPAGLDLCAPGVGAPHIRQRLWWFGERLADTANLRRAQQRSTPGQGSNERTQHPAEREGSRGMADSDGQKFDGSIRNENSSRGPGSSNSGRMGDSSGSRSQGHGGNGNDGDQSGRVDQEPLGSTRAASGTPCGLANTASDRRGEQCTDIGGSHNRSGEEGMEQRSRGSSILAAGGLVDSHLYGREPGDGSTTAARYGDAIEPTNFWSDSTFILCRDGKHRRIPTEPALFPLADGIPYKLARRGSIRPALLKGAGNAIVPEVAADFIVAVSEILGTEVVA